MILEKNAALRFLWDQTMFQELEIMVPLIQSWLAAIYRKEVYNSIYVCRVKLKEVCSVTSSHPASARACMMRNCNRSVPASLKASIEEVSRAVPKAIARVWTRARQGPSKNQARAMHSRATELDAKPPKLQTYKPLLFSPLRSLASCGFSLV